MFELAMMAVLPLMALGVMETPELSSTAALSSTRGKLIATASLPLSSPVQLRIEYGVVFGGGFDTGDLWKFCRELTEKSEATGTRQDSDPAETGNPYQSPQA